MARKKRKNINAKKAAARQETVKPVKIEIKGTQDVKETALTMEEERKGANMVGQVKEAAAEKTVDVKEEIVEKAQEMKEAVKEKAEEVKEMVQEVGETAMEKTEEVRESMEEKAEKVKEVTEEKVEEMKEEVDVKTEKAEETVQEVKEAVEEVKEMDEVKEIMEEKMEVEEETKEPAPEIYVQYHGLENDMASVIRRIKESYYSKGDNTAPIDTLQIYIKPEDYTAYYVINEIVDGKVSLF